MKTVTEKDKEDNEDKLKDGVLVDKTKIQKKKHEVIQKFNRMKLHKSSIEFKYFLFEDRLLKQLNIYTLERDDDGEYEFKFQYELKLRQDGVEALFKILDIPIESGIEDDDIDAFFGVLN